MGRESDDEREARLKQAGRWLNAELEKRSWTQRYLAGQLGVAPQQVSAYANGRYEIDPGFVPDIARLFGLSELDVWKHLGLRLPRDYEPAGKPRSVSTLEAIESDPSLDEETREHFANQYRILKGLTEYRRQAESPDAALPPEEVTLAAVEATADPGEVTEPAVPVRRRRTRQ